MAEQARRRLSFGAIVGWVLTVPGFLMIAGIVAHGTGVLDLAGCSYNLLTGAARCAAGPLGTLMNVLNVAAVLTYYSMLIIVGVVPMAWSLLYPLLRWQARRAAAAAAR